MNALSHPKPRRRVVLVDAAPVVLSAIESFLFLETDHEVISFCCPHEALQYMASHPVDVVVADLMLTDMDGVTFFDKVRELDQNVRMVMLSGCAEGGWRETMRARGLYGCLDKPWCNDELNALIEGKDDDDE